MTEIDAMCGRFYIDDDTAREIEKTIRKVDAQLRTVPGAGDVHFTGDVCPTNVATVIAAHEDKLAAVPKRWGFPGFGTQKPIINARAESILEKKMFRESVLTRRIIIPVAGFYEWNKQKEKAAFTSLSKSVLYLAGCYNRFEGEDRFVILTTAANASMKDVHDRMPLIFEEEEVEAWLQDNSRLEEMLHKTPQQLCRRMEYEQQMLEFADHF